MLAVSIFLKKTHSNCEVPTGVGLLVNSRESGVYSFFIRTIL